MRFVRFQSSDRSQGLAVSTKDGLRGLASTEADFPGYLEQLLALPAAELSAAGQLLATRGHPIDGATLLPPLMSPPKLICIGLNYRDHSAESGFVPPDYPTVFARYASSLIGDGAALVRPKVSTQFDYEGELAVVIGRGGRHISMEAALDHVAGYSVFNDGSIRDYQRRTPQWTIGKTFDGTGAFGPAFVTADELPPGCRGLRLRTRLNGVVMQDALIDDMIFDVATLVSLMSEAMTLQPGDIIVSGTPAGVGVARQPPVFLKPGDICEVEIDHVGLLRNPVVDESSLP